MDLTQRKLTKSEWESIEVPVSENEKEIAKLIKKGFHDINIRYNNNKSLLSYMHVSNDMHKYLYDEYFAKNINNLCKKYNIKNYSIKTEKYYKHKKADIIRINNINKNSSFPYINNTDYMIFEYLILEIIEHILKYKSRETSKWIFYYYTLLNLKNLNITNCNIYVMEFIDKIIDICNEDVSVVTIVAQSPEMIEKNKYLLKYADISLYDHQKKLFAAFNNELSTSTPKLVLYIAPTATGKTLSPIGLAEKYRVIFVCAAKHVGLALAKSSISAGRKIALAFNCRDAEDIRLHYNAVKEAIRDKRSGTIRKVDNTVGNNVEIIICDIKSYLSAMYYMQAFNNIENIITYWDEPTITMDYEEHPFHEMIKKNWSDNIIPNIVLSSATLPKQDELDDVVSDYISRFGGEILSIVSHDCKKSIPILNKVGEVYLPHLDFVDYKLMKKSMAHCKSYPTIMRYMDLKQIVKFLLYIDKSEYVNERYKITNYFENINEITMVSLKNYYIKVLSLIRENDWSDIYNYFQNKENRYKPYQSNIHIVTSDAYTLTDGPTIYLTNNVEKISKFCLQEANIPKNVMSGIMVDIEFNNNLNKEIIKLEKEFEDATAKDAEKDNKMSNNNRLSPELQRLKQKIDDLRNSIKPTSLPDVFIPNKLDHIKKYKSSDMRDTNAFTSDISQDIVIKIMQLNDIKDTWKVLLLMGIGVFTNHESITYTEIMKELADQQKLYFIIASSDYIYGTNYQFSQGYIGKDLLGITQEKSIQAMGRVGRNSIQQEYSIRFRDDDLIKKLFLPEEEKPEVKNMNKLFCK
jgi:hypothetical protein|tara:strand:+ start:1626 stop:4037 length:2412 start_codon:yes stop_codon:yes gene_type:complete